MPQKIITLQERAHISSNIIGINAYRVNHDVLRQGLIAQGYDVQETFHFLVARRDRLCRDRFSTSDEQELTGMRGRDQSGPILIAHWFAPTQIDANLGSYILDELKPFGLLTNPEYFGNVFGAIVMSLSPQNPERAWRLYATNTLTRYHALIDNPPVEPRTDLPIDVFATLYKRVCELQNGESLLDAGCSFGFLPLVVAERISTLHRVVGVDIETSPFATSQYIAMKRHLPNVQFHQADLLSKNVEQLGQFDTVTMLHVLEHFSEEQMYEVLMPLLHRVQHRLIIAVPYEESQPEEAYGHRQLFTAEKLAHMGQWCIEKIGHGTYEVEDCVGGLLIVYL